MPQQLVNTLDATSGSKQMAWRWAADEEDAFMAWAIQTGEIQYPGFTTELGNRYMCTYQRRTSQMVTQPGGYQDFVHDFFGATYSIQMVVGGLYGLWVPVYLPDDPANSPSYLPARLGPEWFRCDNRGRAYNINDLVVPAGGILGS